MKFVLVIAAILALLFGWSVAEGFLLGLFYAVIIMWPVGSAMMMVSALKKVFTEEAKVLRWDATWDSLTWIVLTILGVIVAKFFLF